MIYKGGDKGGWGDGTYTTKTKIDPPYVLD